jgi:hypothetical protein
VDELDESVEIFGRYLPMSIRIVRKKGGGMRWEMGGYSPIRFVGQSNTRSGLGSRQTARSKSPSPYTSLRRAELAASTPVHASHRGTAINHRN